MKHIFPLILVGLPGLATAQTTPQAVLDEWLVLDTALAGYEMRYDTALNSADLIRLENVEIRINFAFPGMSVAETINLEWMSLQANTYGTVTVQHSEMMSGSVVSQQAVGDQLATGTGQFTAMLRDGQTIVSGIPGAHIYTIDYAEMTAEMTQSNTANGVELAATSTQSMRGLHYVIAMSGGPLGRIDMESTLISGDMRQVQEVAPGDNITMNMTFGPGTMNGHIDLGFLATDPMDLAALDAQANMDLNDFNLQIAADSNVDMTFGLDALTFGGALDASHLAFNANLAGLRVDGTASGLPINLGVEVFGYQFAAPLGAPGSVGAASAGLQIQGFTLGNLLIGLFDPAGTLGQHPLNLQLTAQGEVTALIDLATITSGDVLPSPTVLNGSLQVNGSYGDFDFEAEGEGENQDGMPVGQATASATNLSNFLNKLVQIGLLAPQQHLMMQGMLGMLTTPGPTPNSVQSTMEMRPDGSVWVNGQQMQ